MNNIDGALRVKSLLAVLMTTIKAASNFSLRKPLRATYFLINCTRTSEKARRGVSDCEEVG